MVKSIAAIAFSILLTTNAALAADFSASVSRKETGFNEPVELHLRLTGADAKGAPDLSVLQPGFEILGQQQSEMTEIVNGSASSSVNWDLNLKAENLGPAVIPSISIETDQGTLTTVPLQINIQQSSNTPGRIGHASRTGVFLRAQSDKSEVYKNQLVALNYTLISDQSLSNIQIGDLKLSDAVVEKQGEPKIQKQIVNGKQKIIITLSYLIAPLKSGVVTIPPLTIRADIPSRMPLGLANDPFDEDFMGGGAGADPFAGMQRMMQQMRSFGAASADEPIAIASNPVLLRVLPLPAGASGSLPTSSLKISDSWSATQLRAGEPVTRTVVTEARGVSPSQLMSFDEQLKSNSDAKVYADQPQTSLRRDGNDIIAVRKDVFTIIPERSGELSFPALKAAWWNTATKSPQTSQIAPRSFMVMAGQVTQSAQQNSQRPELQLPNAVTATSDSTTAFHLSPALDVVIALLAVVGLMVFVYEMKKRTSRMPSTPGEEEKLSAPQLFRRQDLALCMTSSEILKFTQQFAAKQWGTAPNASIRAVFSAMRAAGFSLDEDKTSLVCKLLERSLYADEEIDIAQIKRDLAAILFAKSNGRITRNEGGLAELNPT